MDDTLNQITVFSDSLKEKANEWDEEWKKDYLEAIKEKSDRFSDENKEAIRTSLDTLLSWRDQSMVDRIKDIIVGTLLVEGPEDGSYATYMLQAIINNNPSPKIIDDDEEGSLFTAYAELAQANLDPAGRATTYEEFLGQLEQYGFSFSEPVATPIPVAAPIKAVAPIRVDVPIQVSAPSQTSTSSVKERLDAMRKNKTSSTAASTPVATAVTLKPISSTVKLTVKKPLQNDFATPGQSKIYCKGSVLDTSKYTPALLATAINKVPCVLTLDIDSCMNTLYPICIHLFTGSTVQNIYELIVAALNEAAKTDGCIRTGLHTYTIIETAPNNESKAMSRYMYIKVKVNVN